MAANANKDPDVKDQIGDIATTIGLADPAMQISNGIAKVGQFASDTYDQAKGWVQKKLAPTPAPTDINLPKDPKKKVTRPLTRSLSKR
jgi:hypothetical protein